VFGPRPLVRAAFFIGKTKAPTGRAVIHAGSYVRVTMDARQSMLALVAVAFASSTHSMLPSWLTALPVGTLFANG